MGPLPMAGDAGGGEGEASGLSVLLGSAVLLQRDAGFAKGSCCTAAVCFCQRVLSRVQVALQGSCSSTVSDMADLFKFISFFFPPLC